MLGFGLIGWIISVFRNNVTHVDSMWSLFFLVAGFAYTESFSTISDRGMLVTILVATWALRLCIYLTWRNWGPHEDHRYAAIRKNNAPYFRWSSIYIVFGLQAVLAWIISLPILGGVISSTPLNMIDMLGMLIAIFGIVWESIADWQLSRFKHHATNKYKVLDTGVWRYSRHPNYFGEALIWWGFALMAAADGHVFIWFSPVVMTFLLLKFSGVSLMEQTIHHRRPGYSEYVATTNAFIPGLPKRKQSDHG